MRESAATQQGTELKVTPHHCQDYSIIGDSACELQLKGEGMLHAIGWPQLRQPAETRQGTELEPTPHTRCWECAAPLSTVGAGRGYAA
jgi:hypothetical protein